MIVDFKDRHSREFWLEGRSKHVPPSLQGVARRKLAQLHVAATIDDLRQPPGNRLEALKGKRVGQYSIRINEQYRICFEWREGNAYEVEIVDYH